MFTSAKGNGKHAAIETQASNGGIDARQDVQLNARFSDDVTVDRRPRRTSCSQM